MNAICAVIVDDMALARERVRRYLADEPDVEIVGEAGTGGDAVRAIAQLAPALVLLDMRLPDFDGCEVMRRLPAAHRPVVVFLTAHEEHAVKAFDVHALDYLVKPFDRARFAESVARVRRQLALSRGTAVPAGYLERLAIKDRATTELVPVAGIDYIDAAGHYLCVHVGRTVHLIRGTLAELEAALDPAEFARIHRSALVRLDRIRALTARRNGDAEIVLVDGTRLLLSRTYGEVVRARLGLAGS